MFIGKLDTRVTLQKPDAAADDYGQRVPTWANVGDVWAYVEDLRGGEGVIAGADAMVTDHRITIRWRDDLAPTWRIVFGAMIFEIRSLAGVGRKQFLAIGCNLRT